MPNPCEEASSLVSLCSVKHRPPISSTKKMSSLYSSPSLLSINNVLLCFCFTHCNFTICFLLSFKLLRMIYYHVFIPFIFAGLDKMKEMVLHSAQLVSTESCYVKVEMLTPMLDELWAYTRHVLYCSCSFAIVFSLLGFKVLCGVYPE